MDKQVSRKIRKYCRQNNIIKSKLSDVKLFDDADNNGCYFLLYDQKVYIKDISEPNNEDLLADVIDEESDLLEEFKNSDNYRYFKVLMNKLGLTNKDMIKN